jgi:predicted TIM-barrel fold metal-dependent hydrolase
MFTRRAVLPTLVAALATRSGAKEQAAVDPVDTHTHFYDPTRPEGVPWPPPDSPLHRPVYPRHWLAEAEPCGVRQTVVVEASARRSNNDWVLALAAREPCILAFIGNLAPEDVDFAAELRRLAGRVKFRGIRVGGRTLATRADTPAFRRGLRELEALGLTLEVNHLPDPGVAVELARMAPGLTVVLDHCGGAGDPRRLTPAWRDGIAACGQVPNLVCKVSGLPEMADFPAGQSPVDTEFYLPILDRLWTAFGRERLLFGSNWPVCEKGATYAGMMKIVSPYFTARGVETAHRFFRRNARAAYRWPE